MQTFRANYVKENFRRALQQTIAAGVAVDGIAHLLGKSAYTVGEWLSGRHAPSKSELERACGLLAFDLDAISSPAFEIDSNFYQQHLTLDSLGWRLLSRLKAGDKSGAQQILCLMASILHDRLQIGDLPCQLIIDENWQPVIRFKDSSLAEIRLSPRMEDDRGAYVYCHFEYKPTAEDCLILMLKQKDPDSVVEPKPFPLTTLGADSLVAALKTKRDENEDEDTLPDKQREPGVAAKSAA